MSGERSFAGYRRRAAAGAAVRLDLNEAPREAGSAFRESLVRRLAAAEWRRYPDVDGRAARESAAALYGWEVGGTLVGNGSNELLAAAVRALVPRGGRMCALEPSFSMYPVLATRAGAELAPLGLEPPDFVIDAERLAALASSCDVALVCSPNNPTGNEVPEEVIAEVCRRSPVVLWDGAYLDFTATDPRPLLREHRNLAVLRSMSKAWGVAGLRVGALLADPDLVARVATQLIPFDTGWLVEAAYGAALECRAEGEALVRDIVEERDREVAAIAALGGYEAVGSAANFFLLRRPGLGGAELAEALRDRGVSVREIPALDAAGYVRVTVGDRGEGRLLRAALAGLAGVAEFGDEPSAGQGGAR
ncbi:MAG: pyridoxal phosphate-dependent aminotransferase [Acidobacteriota bacterium]